MNSESRIAFYTLGCKLNYAETSTIANNLVQRGYLKVDFEEVADYYVINSCSVTENANKDCRAIVRKALRIAPNARIIIIGCYAQLKPVEISNIEGVSLVLGAKEKFNIDQYINTLSDNLVSKVYSSEIEEVIEYNTSFSHGERTRSFLKVQDGCDYTCTFCTIPLARGKSRSDTILNIVKNAETVAQKGIKEIILTGVNIGDFGKRHDLSKKDRESFIGLINALDKVDGISRFRISSIEPNLLSNDIIEFVSRSDKFVPHFHIPLQSGSNEILSKMKRRYKKELYIERLAAIKSLMPDCCIGVDVIVGFPGETKADFLETYRFINELDVSYLHVFTYSERADTEAAQMNEKIPVSEKKERSKMLRILSEKKKIAFYKTQLNSIRPVLFEEKHDKSKIFGFTDNYVKVELEYDDKLVNAIIDVELVKISSNGNVEATVPLPLEVDIF